jgi:DNA repair exonuclease SbcCD nuclease subunit
MHPNGSHDSRRPLRILHSSDLHFLGDQAGRRTVGNQLSTLTDAVRYVGADALLLAGDIFDTPHVPPEEIALLLNTLGNLPLPTVLLPGNHDAHVFGNRNGAPWPDNVFILEDREGEHLELPDLGLVIWGKPTYDHTPQFRPLEGMPPRPTDAWYVVMGHGLVLDHPDFLGRSSLIMEEELATADCDYIALGHVHAFRDVTRGAAPAFYSGAPWGSTTTPTAALVSFHPEMPTSVEPVVLPIA